MPHIPEPEHEFPAAWTALGAEAGFEVYEAAGGRNPVILRAHKLYLAMLLLVLAGTACFLLLAMMLNHEPKQWDPANGPAPTLPVTQP